MRLDRIGRVPFGDRTGLALFLGALSFYGLYWRVDVFIVDTFAVVNALVALTDGHLHFAHALYGPANGDTPGVHAVGGRLYGRNYGQAVTALPFLLALEALDRVADVRLALTGLWSLIVVALSAQVGALVGRRRVATVLGCVVGLVAFVSSVPFASELPPEAFPLAALQLATVTCAAFVGVVAYRLLAAIHGRRVGVAGGVAVATLGPVGFWASIPKRHAVTALLALVALYALYRSRAEPARELPFRCAAYAAAALTAWVSAPEGLALLAALVPVDLLTARRRDPVALATIAAAFLVALAPFLLTNLAISGDPLRPPRMLPDHVASGGGGSPVHAADAAPADPGDVDRPTGSSSVGPAFALGSLTDAVAVAVGAFVRELGKGFSAFEADRLFYVYVRGGRIPGVDYGQVGGHSVELTVLESAPLLGALGSLPVLAAQHVRARAGTVVGGTRASMTLPPRVDLPAARTADLFAGSYVVLFSLLYLPRLPLHATITVRYLIPTIPLLGYAVFRVPAIRMAVDRELRLLCGTALATTPAILLFAAAAVIGADPGTAMQAHAVANLSLAFALGGWAIVATVRDVDPRAGAGLLGLTLAASLAFLLLSGLEYFGAGRQFALPLADAIKHAIPFR